MPKASILIKVFLKCNLHSTLPQWYRNNRKNVHNGARLLVKNGCVFNLSIMFGVWNLIVTSGSVLYYASLEPNIALLCVLN